MADEGIPLGEVRSKLVEFLIRAAAQGSTPAIGQLTKLLAEIEAAGAAEAHAKALADLGQNDDKCPLVTYLGGLGESAASTEAHLGRPMTGDEVAAWQRGHRDRALEARALELHRARSGTAPVPEWALRPPPVVRSR